MKIPKSMYEAVAGSLKEHISEHPFPPYHYNLRLKLEMLSEKNDEYIK